MTTNVAAYIYNPTSGVDTMIAGFGLVPAATGITVYGASNLILDAAANAGFLTKTSCFVPLQRYAFPDSALTALTAPSNNSISIQYVPVKEAISVTRLDVLAQINIASTANSSYGGIGITNYAGVYTLNPYASVSSNSTTVGLSLLSSGSQATVYAIQSNATGNTQLLASGLRPVSVPMAMSLTPGEYYVAYVQSTAASFGGTGATSVWSSISSASSALGITMSMYGGNQVQTAQNYAEITAATATSNNWYSGMGIYSVTTSNALPNSLPLSNINMTGANLSAANIALVFRNY
jgi:hypothetical protein